MSSKAASTAWIVLALLLCFSVLEINGLNYKTDTFDEPYHFAWAQRAIRGSFARLKEGEDTKLLFSVLNVIPITVAQSLPKDSGIRDSLETLLAARLMTVLFGLIVGTYVFRWSSALYDRPGGLLSLFLFTFSPNVLAHSRLVTTDMYAAGMYLIACYYFWRYLNQPTARRAAVSAAVLGLAQLSKCSCVLLFGIFLLIALIRYALLRRRGESSPVSETVRTFALHTVIFAVGSILVINAGFLFTRTGERLADYHFQSATFQRLQSRLSGIPWLRVPFPYSYVDGLDFTKYNEETGRGFGSTYLLGEIRKSGGFPGYFFYCYLFKEPIASQIFVLAALVLYLLHRKRFDFVKNELVLFTTVICFSIYVNFLSTVHIGIRHFLPAIVLLVVFCGSVLSPANGLNAKRAALGIVPLLVYLVVSVVSYNPHYMSYFNEIVWDRKLAYQYLSDSNLDWSDNRAALADYLKAHPDVIFEPPTPREGTIIVSADALTGVWVDGAPTKDDKIERFRWLREHYQPVDHLAYSYLIFKVPPGGAGSEKSSNEFYH